MLYGQCSEQYIVSSSGAVGLNLNAVNCVFDWNDIAIEDRSELWTKVSTIANYVIQECRLDAEEKAKANAKKG